MTATSFRLTGLILCLTFLGALVLVVLYTSR